MDSALDIAGLARLASENGPPPWPFADAPLLIGLERWTRALALRDLPAAVRALCRAGLDALPDVLATGGDEIDEMGFRAGDAVEDGAPVETQLQVADAQTRLAEPDLDALYAAFDPSRQLHIWSEDLLPDDDRAWAWFAEVGQCALAAIKGLDDGYDPDPDSESYYWWPVEVTASRGFVVLARALRHEGADLAAIVTRIGRSIATET